MNNSKPNIFDTFSILSINQCSIKTIYNHVIKKQKQDTDSLSDLHVAIEIVKCISLTTISINQFLRFQEVDLPFIVNSHKLSEVLIGIYFLGFIPGKLNTGKQLLLIFTASFICPEIQVHNWHVCYIIADTVPIRICPRLHRSTLVLSRSETRTVPPTVVQNFKWIVDNMCNIPEANLFRSTG